MNKFLNVGRTSAAAALGLAPGLFFPFVLALLLQPKESDTALLAFSVATSLIGVVVPAAEAKSIAIAGRSTRQTGRVTDATYRSTVWNSLRWAVTVTAVGALLLGALYGGGEQDPTELWVLISVVSLSPLIGSIAAVNAGILISHGSTFLAIATQGLRAAVPLFALLLFPGLSALWLAVFFLAGELARMVTLIVARQSISSRQPVLDRDGGGDGFNSPSGGLAWQMGANIVGELNPVAARTYLTPFQSGSVTAFELSEKAVALSTQIAYNFVTLRRVGKWALSSQRSRDRIFRRDIRVVFWVALVSSILGIAVIQLARILSLTPEAWDLGLSWACVALTGGPAIAVTSSAVRYIVIVDKQRTLVAVVTVGAIFNALIAGLLISALGPIGVVIALITTRYLVMASLLVVVARHATWEGQ